MKTTERRWGTVAFGATFVVICCVVAACAAAAFAQLSGHMLNEAAVDHQDGLQRSPQTEIEVGWYDRATNSTPVHLELLEDHFADGTPIEEIRIEKTDEGFTLVRRGKTRDGNCLSTFTPLVENINGSLLLLRGTTSDACLGDPCSLCAFNSGTGCFCKKTVTNPDGKGRCNHQKDLDLTIIKPEVLTP